MALRVLLADESPTIKKVFQLTLQDFAVDVLSVNVGVDVVAVAQKFKPDIIFADVLLQKKSGYEVTSELKAHNELKNVPVVLIWSGFMELDEDKFQACGADARLEKPFESKHLRALVQKLVPKTQEQNLSEYLQFPDMPEFTEDDLKPSVHPGPDGHSHIELGPPPLEAAPEPEPETLPPDTELDDFAPLDLAETQPEKSADDSATSTHLRNAPEFDSDWLENDNDDGEEAQWAHKTLANYSSELGENDDDEVSQVQYVVPDEPISESDVFLQSEVTATGITAVPEAQKAYPEAPKKESPELTPPQPPATKAKKEEATSAAPIPQMDEKQLEEIIRAQSKEMIEAVIWKIVPEIAKQVIEKEVKSLLAERERKARNRT